MNTGRDIEAARKESLMGGAEDLAMAIDDGMAAHGIVQVIETRMPIEANDAKVIPQTTSGTATDVEHNTTRPIKDCITSTPQKRPAEGVQPGYHFLSVHGNLISTGSMSFSTMSLSSAASTFFNASNIMPYVPSLRPSLRSQ